MFLNLIAVSISVLIYIFMHQGMREGIDADQIFSSDETFFVKRIDWNTFVPRYHLYFLLCKEEYLCLTQKIVPSLVPP